MSTFLLPNTAPDGEGDVADLGGEGARAAQVDGLGLDRGEVLRAEGQVEEHLRKRGYRARPGIGRIVHAGSPISFSCR